MLVFLRANTRVVSDEISSFRRSPMRFSALPQCSHHIGDCQPKYLRPTPLPPSSFTSSMHVEEDELPIPASPWGRVARCAEERFSLAMFMPFRQCPVSGSPRAPVDVSPARGAKTRGSCFCATVFSRLLPQPRREHYSTYQMQNAETQPLPSGASSEAAGIARKSRKTRGRGLRVNTGW